MGSLFALFLVLGLGAVGVEFGDAEGWTGAGRCLELDCLCPLVLDSSLARLLLVSGVGHMLAHS